MKYLQTCLLSFIYSKSSGSCNLNSQCTCIKKCNDGDDEDPERSEKKSTPSPTQTNLQSRHGESIYPKRQKELHIFRVKKD